MPKLTIELDEDTLEAARDAVVALSSINYGYTLRQLAESALQAEVHRLRDEHNGGRPFPPRGGRRLRKGPTVR